MRKYFWYIDAYLRKHGKILFGSIIGAVLFFSAIIPLVATRITPKPKRYIGIIGNYTLTSLPTVVQDQLSRGLTKLDPDGSVSPDLASRWIVEDNDRTYRFLIRDDVIWQDGRRLDPDDITYSFPDVEVITSANDIVFKLPDTFVPFPTIVTQPLLRIEETNGFLGFNKKTRLVGVGSYRMLSSEEQGTRLTELAIEGPTEFIIYRFYLTEQDAITAYKLGAVDELSEIADPAELVTWDNTQITANLHTDRYLAVFFNLNDPLFTKNVRQALSYALKKPTDESRAIGPINPTSWAYLEGGKSYEYDLERAIERMLSEIPQQKLSFELTTIPTYAKTAELIKQNWEVFGQQAFASCEADKNIDDKSLCEHVKPEIKIKITNFPDTNDFQSLLVAQVIPPDPDQYFLWHSEQDTNFTHYKNTRIDSLLEKGRQVADKQERRATYQEFQQFFLEDAPAIFIEHVTLYNLKRE